MPQTTILPPLTAVQLVWARTGVFSNDETSRLSATMAEGNIKDVKTRAEIVDSEKDYVLSALTTMDSTHRSLEIIHKKRELDFGDNQKLRSIYLESVKDTEDFGNKAQDYLKSLPTILIGGSVGGTVATNIEMFKGSPITPWLLGLAASAAGYLAHLLAVRKAREGKQKLFIFQDYERNVYYDQFVSRVVVILTALYQDLDRLHNSFFGNRYPLSDANEATAIQNILKGVRSTSCKDIHKHMMEKKITPELWPLCETGKQEGVEKCPHWGK